jgi:hypothetical protein
MDIGSEHYKCMNVMTTLRKALLSFCCGRMVRPGAGGPADETVALFAIDRGLRMKEDDNWS